MKAGAEMRGRNFLSYAIVCLLALVAASIAELLGLEAAWRYALGFALLTIGVPLLLALQLAPRMEPALPSTEISTGLDDWEIAELEISTRRKDRRGGINVTRASLGLERAEARSGEAVEMPALWIPSVASPQAVWLQASGAALIVGARAHATGPRFARVAFPEFQAVYVLLRRGRGEGRMGRVTVPNLARDLVDQRVAVVWLDKVEELPAGDAEEIAASISYSNHAARAEWRAVVATLPSDHPIRTSLG